MIDPAPALPAMGLVLINPNLPVSTAAVFSEFGGGFTSAGRFDAPIESAGRFNAPFEKAKDFAAALSERHNDLMTPARKLEPEINTVLDAIKTSTGRSLGFADIALRNLTENREFAQFIAGNNLALAKFREQALLARSGNTTGLIALMLQFANSLTGGTVA